MNIGTLTISDRAAAGSRTDESGPRIQKLVAELLNEQITISAIVPDNQEEIAATLRNWSDQRHLDLILTTGGTGLTPRDVTPEATRAVIERDVPGIAEALRVQSLRYTPMAMLSRGVAGVRGQTLIVNLPGSPRAVQECLEYLCQVLPHAINMLGGGPQGH